MYSLLDLLVRVSFDVIGSICILVAFNISDSFLRHAQLLVVVWIGDNVTIGKRCIIKDNCVIESGVTLGDDTVVPPFTRITSSDPTFYQELPPRTSALLQEMTIDRFTHFSQIQRDRT